MMKKYYQSFMALLLAMLLLTACGQTPQAAPEASQPASTEEVATQVTESVLVDICAETLLQSVSKPVFGPVGGEWSAIGLARWGGEVPQEWFDNYYAAVEAYVKDCGGILHERKYTEYSRVILALTAIGKNPEIVGGYNLLAPLADFEQTTFQGVNGPVFTLLALDSGNYEIPANTTGSTQATRELYVDYILSMESPEGGWSLTGGEADVDITAMVLQALSNYQDRRDVCDAAERALNYLSNVQNEDGGFTAFDNDSSESVSQVIVALTQWGISIEDPRFVKNGNTLQDRLLDFMTQDYRFRHTLDADADLMATEQAFLALTALHRAEQGKPAIYNMAQ